LVSTVQIFDRTINLDGKAVPMGGIGSVFTREDYRHQRVASALMRLAVETLGREGFEVSLLFAERLTFYNQFGWREVGRKFGVIADAAKLKTKPDTEKTIEIGVFDLARDLREVAEIHRGYTGRFNVTVIRDESEWRANYSFAGNQPMHPGEGSEEYFIVARGAERVQAYARAIRLYGITMVMEYGYRPGGEEALFALLRHLAQSAQGLCSSFRLTGDHRRAARLRSGSGATAPTGALISHTAHDKALEDRLAAAGAPVTHHVDNNYMWRIIAPDKLAARLGTTPEATASRAFKIFADDNSLFWTADRF
ncbi:MAG: GNAT family N-acetyltransferase, partial [Pseudomonadota bacterium]